MGGLVLALAGTSAGAQVPAADADYSAYAAGSAVHVSGLQQPDISDPTATRTVNAEEAFASASVDSKGLDPAILNEMSRTVSPQEPDFNSYARGTGMEVGLAVEGQEPNQIVLAGLAEAMAPPSTDVITEELGPVPAAPLAYASLVRGQAQALWNEDGSCILNKDISFGVGYAADAELVGTGTDDPATPGMEGSLVASNASDENPRAAAQTTSRTRLVPQALADGTVIGDALGVMAEVRQTLAPVTLFEDTPNEVTLEFAGEWVLRAVATGIDDGAYIHYGPGDVSPTTRVLTIIRPDGTNEIITLQQILGDEGLQIDLPGGLLSLSIGEDPRAIGGTADDPPTIAADGTHASAAVDVVRVQLLNVTGTGTAADIRIGHMEVSATVPAGGLLCPALEVDKSASETSVKAGETFDYDITVTNPDDCTVTDVMITDVITADPGITFTVDSTDPAGAEVDGGTVTWTGLGPIEPGDSLTVSITVTVGEDSAAGIIHDRAEASGKCVIGDGDEDFVPTSGEVEIDAPTVTPGGDDPNPPPVVVPPPSLPRTGAAGAVAITGLGLLGAAFALRRRG